MNIEYSIDMNFKLENYDSTNHFQDFNRLQPYIIFINYIFIIFLNFQKNLKKRD